MDAELRRAHAEMDEGHWWFRGRRRIIASVLDRHHSRGTGPVIDVGCGAGGLLSTVAQHGDRVIAVEGDVGLAAVAQRRHPSADVRVGHLPAALEGLPAATLITAFDVIEHLDDDVGTLRAMAARLQRDGAVCVTVPAVPLLWSEHDVANGHRRRYTARTLRGAMEGAGLTVDHLSYFNVFLFPVVLAARLLSRVRPASTRTDFDRSAGPLDRLFAGLFGAERHLVARWCVPIGVSLIAVGRLEMPDR